MPLILNANDNNFHCSNYLSSCDLINKYNIKNVESCSKLSRVVLEFSSSDFLNACEITNKKEWDSEIQIKAFLLLYILQANSPYINFNKGKINKESSDYSIKIILSGAEDMHSFVTQVFIENWASLLVEDFEFFQLKNFKTSKYTQQNFKHVVSTKLPVSSFVELDNMINKTLFGITSKSLNIKASFLFNSNLALNNNQSLGLLKNLPFFWLTNSR